MPFAWSDVLSTLFVPTGRVDRRTYLRVGAGLMTLKYASDAALIGWATGQIWTPPQYLSPLLTTRDALLANGPSWVMVALALWTLPFLWIGLVMTLKRAVDAGSSPALCLLFLVPGLNYLLMGYLALRPSADVPARVGWGRGDAPPAAAPWSSALLGTLLGVSFAVALTAISTLLLGEYGVVLFFTTPAIVGATASWWYNREVLRSVGGSIGVALLSVCIAAGALLLFALEGIICLLMAAPIGLVLGALGGAVGRALAVGGRTSTTQMALLCLALPLIAAAEARVPNTLPLREVATTIVIDAPPEAVWPNVVGFSELPEAPSWLHRLGVAYPMRARIEGEGVGAVRHCEFSTGAFVEPITTWDAPNRLSFDVIAQPVPMHEWSPYRHVHPPHLDGYLQSHRGEFRLIRLPDGRTQLEGSTWYTMDLAPTPYWMVWSDAILHGIHRRVLRHVKVLSESGHASVPSAILPLPPTR